MAYYHPGLGTMGAPGAWTAVAKSFSKLLGLAFGRGLPDDLEDPDIAIARHAIAIDERRAFFTTEPVETSGTTASARAPGPGASLVSGRALRCWRGLRGRGERGAERRASLDDARSARRRPGGGPDKGKRGARGAT